MGLIPQFSRTIRYAVAGAVVIAAVLFHVNKWVPPVMSQADFDRACKSVAGCKGIALTKASKQDSARWPILITVAASRKVKNTDFEQQILTSIERQWESRGGWRSGIWADQSMEVRYE